MDYFFRRHKKMNVVEIRGRLTGTEFFDMVHVTPVTPGLNGLISYPVNESGVAQSAGTATDPVHVLTPQSKIVSPTITVATAAYTANDCVGGVLTLTDAMRENGGTGYLKELLIKDGSGTQKPALEILVFNATPAASTFTDGDTAVLHADDVPKVIGHIPVYASNYTLIGGVYVARVDGLDQIVQSGAASKNLYAAIVCPGTPDFVAATDLNIDFKFMRE
jgi:hypothetical protein